MRQRNLPWYKQTGAEWCLAVSIRALWHGYKSPAVCQLFFSTKDFFFKLNISSSDTINHFFLCIEYFVYWVLQCVSHLFHLFTHKVPLKNIYSTDPEQLLQNVVMVKIKLHLMLWACEMAYITFRPVQVHLTYFIKISLRQHIFIEIALPNFGTVQSIKV